MRFSFLDLFSTTVFCEDHNKECPPTNFEQFTKCAFEEIFSQTLTTCLNILYLELLSKRQIKKEGSNQASN